MKRIIFGKTLFIKIFAIFFAVILPIYLLEIQINIWDTNETRAQIMLDVQSKIVFYADSVDREFLNVQQVQREFVNNREVQSLNNKSLTDMEIISSDVHKIQEVLKRITQVSNYVSNAYLFIPSIRRTISNNSYAEFTSDDEMFIDYINKHNVPIMFWKDKIYLNLVNYDFSVTTGQAKPMFISSVEISEGVFEQVMKNYFNYPGGGVTIIGDDFSFRAQNEKDQVIYDKLKKFLEEKQSSENIGSHDFLTIGKQKFAILYKKIDLLNLIVMVYMPQETLFSSLSRYPKWILFNSILILIMLIIFLFSIHYLISGPMNRLVNALKEFEDGDLNVYLTYKRNDEFRLVYKRFNNMFKKIRTLIEDVYEKEILVQRAELKQLQYQINPHFLYNCLFIVAKLAKIKDFENVQRMANYLSKYYQYITRGATEDVTLLQEVDHSRKYLHIQKMRFGDRIDSEFDEIPEGYENFPVPKLILQPLIENAYKYALEEKSSEGRIEVKIKLQNNILFISIEDNGKNLDESKILELDQKIKTNNKVNEITGLVNVHRRLCIKYGIQSGLFLMRGTLGGLRVEIRIPTQSLGISEVS